MKTARRLTLAEWGALDEDAPGELVDGFLQEEEVPTVLHEQVVLWLVYFLNAWLIPRGGVAFASELKLGVAPKRGRKPDVSVYLPGSPRPKPTAPVIRERLPDILIEVLSPLPKDQKRDRLDKLSDYAAAGVRRYWIVDPQLRAIQLFELGRDRRYAVAQSGTTGKLKVRGMRGFSLDLTALWRFVDDEAERAE